LEQRAIKPPEIGPRLAHCEKGVERAELIRVWQSGEALRGEKNRNSGEEKSRKHALENLVRAFRQTQKTGDTAKEEVGRGQRRVHRNRPRGRAGEREELRSSLRRSR